MPQLGGPPTSGTRSMTLPRNIRGNVDLTQPFLDHLKAKGIKVTDGTAVPSTLKPSQSELNADVVSSIIDRRTDGTYDEKPAWVSNDGYVIDGHHRWAAAVKDGDRPVPTRTIDLPIGAALSEAHAFANKWGVRQEGINQVGGPLPKIDRGSDNNEKLQSRSIYLPLHDIDPFEPQDADTTARELIVEAQAAEPRITNTLENLAKANGGVRAQGHEVKSKDRLVEKIIDKRAEIEEESGEKLPISETGTKVFDTLRYTIMFSPDKYAAGVRHVLDTLEQQGYTVPKRRIKNTWNAKVYKGLNTTVRSPEGQHFELQFHTPDSFDLKNNQLHPLFEEERKSSTSPELKAKLNAEMARLSRNLLVPGGVEALTPEALGT